MGFSEQTQIQLMIILSNSQLVPNGNSLIVVRGGIVKYSFTVITDIYLYLKHNTYYLYICRTDAGDSKAMSDTRRPTPHPSRDSSGLHMKAELSVNAI